MCRFLKFQGPLAGQNQYVANNYTLTQPQGVRHMLLRWKSVIAAPTAWLSNCCISNEGTRQKAELLEFAGAGH